MDGLVERKEAPTGEAGAKEADMGIMKQSKVTNIGNDAVAAREKGHRVFVCRYWDEVLNFQSTGSIAGATEAIEAVEAAGWKLDDFSYAWAPEKKRGISVMVFRPSGEVSQERFRSVPKDAVT